LRRIKSKGIGVLYRGGDGYREVIYPGEEGLIAEIMTRSKKCVNCYR